LHRRCAFCDGIIIHWWWMTSFATGLLWPVRPRRGLRKYLRFLYQRFWRGSIEHRASSIKHHSCSRIGS
jgi:hypothetical protein